MSNIFTLDSMREEIEREFAPCRFELPDGEVVTLRNILRLPKNDREKVYTLLDELADISKADEDGGLVATEKSAEVALKILPLVADSEKLGRQLVEAIEEDLALTLRVFSAWMEGTQAGKRRLAQLIDEYGEHLAADLMEHYRVDLRDIFDPQARLTPLYVLVLIRGLPEDCRFNAERRGGQEFRGWDVSRYATVAIVNAVRALQYTYVAAHSKSRPRAPEPFPTPDAVHNRKYGPGSFASMAAQQLAAGRKED